MKSLYIITTIICLASCGSKHDSGEGDAATASNLSLADLQTQVPTEVSGLISAFGFTDGISGGLFVAFFQNNLYFSGYLDQTAPNSFRTMAHIGTYSVSGNTITMTPKKTSCAANAKQTANVTIQGDVNGNAVSAAGTTSEVVLAKLDTSHDSPNGSSLQWGCFDFKALTFTAGAWTDVTSGK